MPKNDIGGFFVHLGVDVDKDSFEKGNKLVDGISDSFNKLIGTARNAMVVLASWKTVQDIAATGALENQIYMDSEAMGVEVEALNAWIASAKIAGVNSDGLVNSMGRLANVLNHITIDGSGIEAYASQLGKLRIGIEELEKLNDPAAAYELIIATAQERAAEAQQKIVEARNALELNPGDRKAKNDLLEAQKEKQRITVIVGDILGTAGQEYFIKLQNQKLGVADALSKASKTQFTDAQDNQNGMNFLTEWNTLGEEFKSIKRLLGDEAGELATPYLKQLNEWIQNNGDTIKNTINTISDKTANTIAKGIETISNWWETHGDEVLEILNTISIFVTGIATKVLEFGKSSKGKAVKDYFGETITSIAPATKNILQTAWEGGDIFGAMVQGFNDVIADPLVNLTKGLIGNEEGNQSGVLNLVTPAADNTVNGGASTPSPQEQNPLLTGPAAEIIEPVVTVANSVENKLTENNQRYKDRTTIITETQKLWNEKYGDHPILNQWKKISFDELPEDLQNGILKIRETDNKWLPNTVKMNDGIMRPDGTVTQVAPDDWVIAARNLGDVVEAFRPQENKAYSQQFVSEKNNTQKSITNKIIEISKETENNLISTAPHVAPETNGTLSHYINILASSFYSKAQQQPQVSGGEYTINQTFNINGGNDMPQVIRQQAYNGTQEGLLGLMNQSSRRLQMMSGTM